MQSLPGENPPEHEVPYLESPGVDVAAMVPPQRLLVSCRPKRGLPTAFLPQHEIHPPDGVLTCLIEHQDPRGAMLDLVWENRFSSVDEEEWRLSRWLGHGDADGPLHILEFVEPAPAAALELLLEGPCLEPLRTLALVHSAWPLLLGCGIEA